MKRKLLPFLIAFSAAFYSSGQKYDISFKVRELTKGTGDNKIKVNTDEMLRMEQ